VSAFVYTYMYMYIYIYIYICFFSWNNGIETLRGMEKYVYVYVCISRRKANAENKLSVENKSRRVLILHSAAFRYLIRMAARYKKALGSKEARGRGREVERRREVG
jgi:hypothetical protein